MIKKVKYLFTLITLFSFLAVISCDFKSKDIKKESVVLYPILQDGKWGYIDKTGKIVINPQFDNAWRFNDGLAKVRFGEKYGFIDKKGKIVINPQFDGIWGEFSEGLIEVRLVNEYSPG
jgi:hypothetical protein